MTITAMGTATAAARSKVAATSGGPILVVVDGSQESDFASKAAIDLAGGLHLPLHVVHCRMPLDAALWFGQFSINTELDSRDPGDEVLRTQVLRLQRLGANIAGERLLRGRPADKIPDLAARIGAQLIIIGSRGLGMVKRFLVDSVSDGVVHAANTPVLVLRRGGYTWPPDRILVGVDGSDQSRTAAERAAAIARTIGAELTIATVTTPAALATSWPGEAIAAGEMMTRELADQLAKAYGIAVQTVALLGDPAAALITAANLAPIPAMLAVGSQGLGALSRLAVGSVSTKVLHGAKGPVLIAKLKTRKVRYHALAEPERDCQRAERAG